MGLRDIDCYTQSVGAGTEGWRIPRPQEGKAVQNVRYHVLRI